MTDLTILNGLPRVKGASLPTPFEEAPRLSRAVGGTQPPRLFIKRDDLTGLATGGNKVRKLEYLVADALAKGCDTLITTGAVQSNHARQTAAFGARYGLDVILMLSGKDPGQAAGNHLLDLILGADVRFAGVDDEDEVWRKMQVLGEELGRQGRKAYLIPVGGSVPLGAMGYVAATLELADQAIAAGVRMADLYVASSSAGTQGGIELGLCLARERGFEGHCIGISVARPSREVAEKVAELANLAAGMIGADYHFVPEHIEVLDQYIGPGYAIPTPEGTAAIKTLARTEGIITDPVYSGKALSGLIGQVGGGRYFPGQPVIFWHTGGIPALFVLSGEFTGKR
ncbi:MAG TPA: D-cysteine desulfhydrase family protein [Bacillota bacterium]